MSGSEQYLMGVVVTTCRSALEVEVQSRDLTNSVFTAEMESVFRKIVKRSHPRAGQSLVETSSPKRSSLGPRSTKTVFGQKIFLGEDVIEGGHIHFVTLTRVQMK